MNQDTTLINRLWWLRKFLDNHFNTQEYKEVYNKPLDTDTMRELDEIVAHIKLNY